MLDFQQPTREDAQYFPTSSDYSLSYNVFHSFTEIWGDVIDITIARTKTALYTRLRGGKRFLLPYTENLEAAMAELEAHCKESGDSFIVESVTTEDAMKLQQLGYTIERNRDLDEYLYTSEKLIKLSGRKLQSKRNHISQFERKYTYSIRSMSKKEIREECYTMASTTWIENKDEMNDDIKEELQALRNALDKWDELKLVGMIICIDHHLSAFTIGEEIDENLAIIHFEKGDTHYAGVYPVINQLFCSQYLGDITYINRQEDAGVAGLRKAKKSYRPDLMVEKYRVTRT